MVAVADLEGEMPIRGLRKVHTPVSMVVISLPRNTQPTNPRDLRNSTSARQAVPVYTRILYLQCPAGRRPSSARCWKNMQLKTTSRWAIWIQQLARTIPRWIHRLNIHIKK